VNLNKIIEEKQESPNFVNNLTKSKKDNKIENNSKIIDVILPEKNSVNDSLKSSTPQKSSHSTPKTKFQLMMDQLNKRHKPTIPSNEKSNEYSFTSKQSDIFNTPAGKKTTPKTRRRRRQDAAERVLTNIGCNGEKIYKLSELYLPNCNKIKKNCMKFIEDRSSITMLKNFESKCLLEPYDLNEQYREFEKNMKGLIEEEEEEEEEEVEREGMELKEFYEGKLGETEKYWDEMLDNTHSLSRVFRRKLINEDGAFKGIDHIMLEKILFSNNGNRGKYLESIRLAKRNNEGKLFIHL
jgi:hypothetical protein